MALSPFCVLSSQGDDGADISPRGDPPGFLRVLDDKLLLLPDRIGNNRLDTFENILTNPMIALLVLIPGVVETLRINGRAQITDGARPLAGSAVRGRPLSIGLLNAVRAAFLHCLTAFVRSELRNPERQIYRSALPS